MEFSFSWTGCQSHDWFSQCVISDIYPLFMLGHRVQFIIFWDQSLSPNPWCKLYYKILLSPKNISLHSLTRVFTHPHTMIWKSLYVCLTILFSIYSCGKPLRDHSNFLSNHHFWMYCGHSNSVSISPTPLPLKKENFTKGEFPQNQTSGGT